MVKLTITLGLYGLSACEDDRLLGLDAKRLIVSSYHD